MTTVLFDTNVLIDYMNGRLEAKAALSAVSGSASISRMTWIEVMAGFDHNDQLLMTQNTVTLSLFDVIEIDPDVAALAARILSERLTDRKAKQQSLPKSRPPDAIIHATAMLYCDQLITSDVADFKDVRCHANVSIMLPNRFCAGA